MKEEKYTTLLQEDANKAISIPKVVTQKREAKAILEIDLGKSNDFRLDLCPSDSIEREPEFLLRIHISEKMRTKISLHTQEKEMSYCLFRVDFNGPRHTNPEEVNKYVPEIMKPFAGKVIEGNHVHYHVQGYPTAAWAVPTKYDLFPVKEFDLKNYYSQLKDIIDAVADFIHLETKIIITGNLMYDGMD